MIRHETDVLVVGAGSFVGRYVARHMIAAGADCVLTALRPEALPAEIRTSRNVAVVPLNLTRLEDFDSLPRKIKTVVHLAAASSQDSVSKVAAVNVAGMKNLLDFAGSANIERFIFASSLSVHGTIDDRIVRSETPIRDPGAYGLSKRLGELLLMEYEPKFSSFSIRLPAVLGNGAKNHWLARVCEKARNDEDIEMFNGDAPFNNAVSISALAHFVSSLCGQKTSGAHAFPVGCSGSMSVAETVARMIETMRSRSNIRSSSVRKTSFTIDSTVAETFGFIPDNIGDAVMAYALGQSRTNQE